MRWSVSSGLQRSFVIGPSTMRDPQTEPYILLAGSIITSWAALEARMASAIWRIGEIPDAIGASITAQIYTFDGLVKALQAILRVRGFHSDAKKLQRLSDATKGLQEVRNRLVHDGVHFHDGAVHRLEITANRRLKFGYRKVDLNSLKATVEAIAKIHDDLDEAIKDALQAVPRLSDERFPLPDISDE